MKVINYLFDKIANMVAFLAYLQLLWLLFILAGLGVFGFFPSTTAMFTVLKRWIEGERDIPVFYAFWYTYKSNFFKANGLGLVITALGYVCYIDYRFFFVEELMDSIALKIMVGIFIYLFITVCVYLMPVYVYFRFRFLEYFKYSFLFSLSMPFKTFGILVILYLLYAVMLYFPGLFLFFGGSVPGYLLMWFMHQMIGKLVGESESAEERLKKAH
jgi:uncharacterized membrane protein YesL